MLLAVGPGLGRHASALAAAGASYIHCFSVSGKYRPLENYNSDGDMSLGNMTGMWVMFYYQSLQPKGGMYPHPHCVSVAFDNLFVFILGGNHCSAVLIASKPRGKMEGGAADQPHRQDVVSTQLRSSDAFYSYLGEGAKQLVLPQEKDGCSQGGLF